MLSAHACDSTSPPNFTLVHQGNWHVVRGMSLPDESMHGFRCGHFWGASCSTWCSVVVIRTKYFSLNSLEKLHLKFQSKCRVWSFWSWLFCTMATNWV